jgi:hypothetical protein
MQSLEENDTFYLEIKNTIMEYLYVNKGPSVELGLDFGIRNNNRLEEKHIFLLKYALNNYLYSKYKSRNVCFKVTPLINHSKYRQMCSVSIRCDNE